MFRFSIRDLLLITLLAALAIAWWLDHGRLQETNRALVKRERDMLLREAVNDLRISVYQKQLDTTRERADYYLEMWQKEQDSPFQTYFPESGQRAGRHW